MIIGIPRETRAGERRVALAPDAVRELASTGCGVRVEAQAGEAVGFRDEAYRAAGAATCTAEEAWNSDLVIKVKEIQPEEAVRLRHGSAIFSFHHLPGEPRRTALLAAGAVTAIAFEMVRDGQGGFPLLAPMSAIAGRMAIDAGQRAGLPGQSRCLILGAGHAGLAAARAALARGLHVVILTRSEHSRDAARALGYETHLASTAAVEQHALAADLVVGAVFVAGQPTPKLLARALVRRMKRGAVIVDVSIDAGGVAETSRATTHASPTFEAEGVIHYAVPNMPAALPVESSAAISAAVLPFALQFSTRGVARAVRENPALREGVLLWKGRVNHPGIAAETGLPYTALTDSDLA